MDRSFERRQKLLIRLLGVTLVSAGAGVYGCGDGTNTSTASGGNGGAGGDPISSGSGNDSFTSKQCFAWPASTNVGGMAGAGGTGGMAGAGGTAGMGGAGGNGGMAGAGGSTPAPCPSKADAAMYFEPLCTTSTVQTEGVFADGQCCYDILVTGCGVGRPFLVAGRVTTASILENMPQWTDSGISQPDMQDLSAADRAVLAQAWIRDGLLEHASIASFGRFALELLAVGAPASLVELAHKAALDEVQHARIAFELASTYAGTSVGPGAFPFAQGRLDVSHHLADVAARAVVEGCIGETLASILAAEQASRATIPAVRAALETIAEDEARHAELAWRTVAWAWSHGNVPVRQSIASAFAKGLATPPSFEILAGAAGSLEAHGRPAADVLHTALARTLDDVIRPAFEALRTQPSNSNVEAPRATA